MDGVHFSDSFFTEALRWRLGLNPQGPPGLCKNAKRSGEECGEILTEKRDHPVECPCGPLCTHKHTDLAEVYADILDEVGGIARREVFVPELSRQQEAWLDVWAYGIPESPDVLLDVTVRHPRASRYRPAAVNQAGAAAAHAETEKLDKYPATNGRSVWPVAHESWGRLGPAAEQLLQACSAAARRRAHRRGRISGGELRRWRARLDGTLQRGIAAQLISSRLGLPGRRPHRSRPLDLCTIEASCAV